MSPKRTAFGYKAGFKRKQTILKTLFAAILVAILGLVPVIYVRLQEHSGNERRELRDYYESGDFTAAFIKSGELLNDKPLDSFLLTIHGFSAYELAIAQINSYNMLLFIDTCIWSLRKSLLSGENETDGRIHYVLGKAYYYKGQGYADLAVSYLEKARRFSFSAADIPEYLGLAYAGIRDYRNSVAAFSRALSENDSAYGSPSDVLLLSIARSYLALEEDDSARAYLIHCLDVSRDSRTITTARLLLGGIYGKAGDINGAELEYLKIVNENGDNAEAYFQLGELYAAQGDSTRARAEWRRVLRIDPAHSQARTRLNI